MTMAESDEHRHPAAGFRKVATGAWAAKAFHSQLLSFPTMLAVPQHVKTEILNTKNNYLRG